MFILLLGAIKTETIEMLDTIENLNSYLSEKDFTKYKELNNCRTQGLTLINRLKKGKLYSTLDKEESAKLKKLLSNILNEFKNFEATNGVDIHLRITYFISSAYELVLEKFESFEQYFSKTISEISDKTLKAKQDLKKIESEYDALSKKLKSSIESNEDTNKKLSNLITDAVDRVNNFSNKIKTENEKKLRLQFNEITDKVNRQRDEWTKKFDSLEDKRKKFENLYEIATTYFRESRFDEYSENESNQANTYRKISIRLMLFVVFFIVGLTIYSAGFDEDAKWYDYITRSLLVFTLMIPAIYTSRESARHRRNADKYTQMANELKAFKITLEDDDLDTEIKNKVREEIYKRYFGNLFMDGAKDIGDSMSDFLGKFSKSKE